MKFYVVEVTRYIEPVGGKLEEYGMYSYDDEILAKATYHQKLSSAMKNANVQKEIVSLMDERGVMIINPDVFDRPLPAPVAEESNEE
jgi:hypothetical protein